MPAGSFLRVGAPLAMAAIGCWASAAGRTAPGTAQPMDNGVAGESRMLTAEELRDQWILEGDAEVAAVGRHEVRVTAVRPMALWCPEVYQGCVVIEFACMVSEEQTKLLVFAHGCGSDGTPVGAWKRSGLYDDYNAGRMEVYSIALNRGPHISQRVDEQLANVRRIGGPEFAIYTAENFRRHARQGRDFWNGWNTRSLLGAAREPASGTGKYLRYRVSVEPPHIRMEVNGIVFAEIVDHRPKPLVKGSVGFRCMSKGKTFYLKDVRIRGSNSGETQDRPKDFP